VHARVIRFPDDLLFPAKKVYWPLVTRKMFLLSQPEDLRLDDLGSSLDAMI
jgi:hypothetical protein